MAATNIILADFSLFWSVLVPVVMIVGSVAITYLLYRHFVGQMGRHSEDSPEQ